MALLDDKGLKHLVGKLKDMFAPKSHTHDDRYYTESEVNTKLNGRAIPDIRMTIDTIPRVRLTVNLPGKRIVRTLIPKHRLD